MEEGPHEQLWWNGNAYGTGQCAMRTRGGPDLSARIAEWCGVRRCSRRCRGVVWGDAVGGAVVWCGEMQ
eukprot:366320-Chlamydomonas_euryale.AAC.7